MDGLWKGCVLLLAIYLASHQAAASPLSSQSECDDGPETWCRDFATAVKCGALDYCQKTMAFNVPGKGVKCSMCKLMVVLMAKVVQDNTTDEKISNLLQKGCQYLPFQDWSVKCMKMVDTGVLLLVALGKQVQTRPEILCGAFRLCNQKNTSEEASSEGALKFQKPLKSDEVPNQDFPEVMPPFIANVPFLLYPQNEPQNEQKEGENTCRKCEKLLDDMQETLANDTFLVQSLAAYAKQSCDLLMPSMASECKKYVFQYTDVFVQLLTSILKSKSICREVGFCDFANFEPLHSVVPADNHPHDMLASEGTENSEGKLRLLCPICKDVIMVVENMLENNVTEEQLVHEMTKVCSMLPHKMLSECQDFVDSYGKAVIFMLLDATKPENVCIMLKCCPKAAFPSIDSIILESLSKLVKYSGGEFCNVCTIFVKYFDDELEKNETQSAIGTLLVRSCKLLPEAFVYPCDELVAQYEPAAMRLIVQVMDPTFVCTKLGACPESPLLGMEACSWGPGYWCKNVETAAQCQATEYCKHHIWN